MDFRNAEKLSRRVPRRLSYSGYAADFLIGRPIATVVSTPLLKGLEGDLCQSPHWGYLLQGKLTVTYADGTEEVINSGDLFYWPPGHTVRVGADAEVILFSPQEEHGKVVDHMLRKMAG